MARRRQQEAEENHEAWVIPYADLMTLLLALFVVMYAISSLNEGKYRVLAVAMTAAFGGSPRSVNPVQVGNSQLIPTQGERPAPIRANTPPPSSGKPPLIASSQSQITTPNAQHNHNNLIQMQRQMDAMAVELGKALAPLIDRKLITVRRSELWIEVEINSDILFATGSATLDHAARTTLSRLAEVLKQTPNGVRVEGHTDNKPIATAQFPSNWELSAARAASVVHLFADQGIAPQRLSMVGYGEFRSRADNSTMAGRNANRRVMVIIHAEKTTPVATQSPAPAPAPAHQNEAAVSHQAPPDATPMYDESRAATNAMRGTN